MQSVPPFQEETVPVSLVKTECDQQRALKPWKMRGWGNEAAPEQDFQEILLASCTFVIAIFLYSFSFPISCKICHLAAAKAQRLGNSQKARAITLCISTFQQLESI
jgi:hypothetical protein